MMKENFRRKQYFSIRKYTKGACSVLLGTSLFLSLSYTGEAKATEEKEVCIHAVDNSSLSEQIRSQLKVFEENKIIVEEGKSYYFVYKKNNVLPSTGGLTSGTTVLGGALLLVCLTLIKKKKGKLIFLVSMLTVSGNLSQAMASSDFEEISPVVVKVVNGGMLPSPEEISGYSFTGYYFEIGKTCVNNSNSIKTEEREEFAPGLVEEKVGEEKKVVVSEKGDPLVQEEKPEGVVSEKGDPLVQPEKPEGVVSEKGDPLVQEEKPEGVVSEKGEPLVQPEKPLASWNGPTLVREENPIAEVSIKGDPLVQPENPEWKPTPEQPTPEVTPKPTKPVEEPKVYNTPIDIDDSDNPPPRPVRDKKPNRVKIPIDELKRSQTPEVIINGKPVIPLSTITTVKELDYKTIYKAGGPFLNFKEREEIEEGDKGVEVTTISYIRDESTGKTVEHISKKIVYQPIDRVIEVGNVKEIVEPIEITEERKDDPELPKGREVVIEGRQGERTKTITYEVNPETGELSNPTVKTEKTRLATLRLILVGTKE